MIAWAPTFSQRFAVSLMLGLLLVVAAATAAAANQQDTTERGTYIVQATDVATAKSLVERVGGKSGAALAVINAVGAELSPEQLTALQALPGIRVYRNAEVTVDGRKKKKGNQESDADAGNAKKKGRGKKGSSADPDTNDEAVADAETDVDTDAAMDTGANGSTDSTESVADSDLTSSSWGTWSDWSSYGSQTYDWSESFAEPEVPTVDVELSADYLRPTEANGFLEWSELARTMERVDYEHPLTVDAPSVHQLGIKGRGITVAVIDTGLWWEANTMLSKSPKLIVDVTGQDLQDDPNGHGTHVASIISSDVYARNGIYEGIAPHSDLAVLRAFQADGSASYLDVIHAIDVAVAKKDEYNIRVLNLSFSAPPQSHYWDDPLNQAVMAAWQAGIVVVASAGNDGPEPMTVGVPGNVPYIITVGAMTDNFTPNDPVDDRLASFSSTGPTYEGFVKPDVIAPGGHIPSSMPFDSYISLSHPESMLGSERNFAMSGTSQAAAIVSGVVALMLENDPALTPDEVKCRLMASTRPAVDSDGTLAYTIFQQGAGLVNALDAVHSSATQCANQGLNIAQDLSGEQHFGGRANQSEDGEYYLMDAEGGRLEGDGYLWSRAYMWSQGYIWSQAYMWSQGYIWSRGYIWSQGYLWSRSVPWSEGAVFSSGLTETMSVNKWVDHE